MADAQATPQRSTMPDTQHPTGPLDPGLDRHGNLHDYQTLEFVYRPHPDQAALSPVRHPVVILGAGPVGLALAIDLKQQGIPVVLLDNDVRLSQGSRAICFAKRTLEIFDRLGCGARMRAKGVSWNLGRVFFQDQPVWAFDLLPQNAHANPAFVNLQQYYVEGYLVERANELGVDLRWRNELTALQPTQQGVTLSIETPEGSYSLQADWLVACDGARSTARRLLGLESHGRSFKDRFLIADIRMPAEFPTERWFWFDPPFHPNQSVLLHRQPDDIWRVDFQLGWDADPELERQPERIRPRIQSLLGANIDFEIVWASVYTFACRRMERFVHNHVIFAGDSAHGVSPFGARGANSGVQDADNLAWKLARVIRGLAPDRLIDTYGEERELAADENILNSTRATDFITPKSAVSLLFRNSVLQLARDHEFMRPLINSGRLSLPTHYHQSVLNTVDSEHFEGGVAPGSPALDAPIQTTHGPAWWLEQLHASEFVLLHHGPLPNEFTQSEKPNCRCVVLLVAQQAAQSEQIREQDPAIDQVVIDSEGLLTQRYALSPGSAVLFRPDQHVCARWTAERFSWDAVRYAIDRAMCKVSERSNSATSLEKTHAPKTSPTTGPMRSTDARWTNADATYDALIQAHQDLNPQQSEALNAALVLLLAHQIGQHQVLADTFEAARRHVLRNMPHSDQP